MARGLKNIDFTGLGLVSLGLASMQIVLDKGQQDDWFSSPFIITWGLISICCLVSAIIWLWNRHEPIIDLSLFKDRAFAISCCLIFLTGFVLYGSSALLPLLLQTQFGYDATLAGFILSPGGFALIFLMPLSGKLVGKIQARYMIVFGLVLCALGMFHTMNVTPQTDFNGFIWMRVTQVLGLPFLFIPVSTLAFSNIPREKSNKASALFSLFRNVGGSIGIALAQTYVSREMQIHQHHLAAHLVPGEPAYETLLHGLYAHLGSMPAAMGSIYHTLQQQSAILAYSSAFQLMGLFMLFAAAVGLVLLPANRPSNKAAASAAAH